MICPYCRSEVRDGSKFCTECGATLNPAAVRQETGRLAANTGLMLGAAAREARLRQTVTEDQLIGDRAYIVGILIAGRSRKPLVSFLGYNLVVLPFGLVISTLVAAYGGVGSQVVTDAFLYTLLIALGMTGAALAFPNLFARLGGALLGVLIGLLVCEIVLLILGRYQTVTDWIAAGLFSLYIGFDVYRSQQFAKTVDNAVDCALDIYLDLANLFVRLLSIMSKKRD